MEGAKAAGPPIPAPPVPQKVLESNKGVAAPKDVVEKESGSSKLLKEDVKRTVEEGKPSGTITIFVYEHKPYEAKFSGKIAGFEMNIARLAMMKQYKLWKHSLSKTGGK